MAKLVNLVASLFVAVVMAASPVIDRVSPAEVPQASHPDRIDGVLAQLSWCESRNNASAYNHDDGGSPSIGKYQFKVATWNYYLDMYGLFPDAEAQERLNLMWDGAAQEVVARRILEDGAWQNWFNCLRPIYGTE